MSTSPGTAQAPPPTASRRRGVLLMATGAVANQSGAGIAAHAFDQLGPLGVVGVRQLVAAVVLLPVARPPLRHLRWSHWWPVLLLALVFACMNASLYLAVDRIGLGPAVTLEFLGPLAVALAGSRSPRDLLAALAAAAGVYVLVLPGPATDVVGVALGLAAAGCWASYILLNRTAGARLPGLQAPALASALATVLCSPVLVLTALDGELGGWPLVAAVAAGVLSSGVPYAVDLMALRDVSAHLFGVFMSVNPLLAALAGLVLLGQVPAVHVWVGITTVVVVDVVALTARAAPAVPG